MDIFIVAMVALSVGVFAAVRAVPAAKSLAMLSAILSAVAAVAAVADGGAESWQIIAVAVTETYIFLSSIIGPEASR